MFSKFKFGILALIMVPLLVIVGCDKDDKGTTPQLETSKVRLIHASYDAPAVDVTVDGVKAVSSLEYGESTGYAEIAAGVRNVKVTPAGTTSPVVIDANLPVEANKEYTVIAVNQLASIEPIVAVDVRTPNPSKAKIRFIHASPDAPAVDIKVGSGSSAPVFSDVQFKEITNYIEVDAGSYQFVVTPAGSASEVVVLNSVSVQNGIVYTVMALGTLSQSQYPFMVRVFVDNDPGNVYVDLDFATTNILVTHASPNAPGVDLLIDDQQINSSPLIFPENTGYLSILAGTRNIKVNVAGSTTTVIDATITLQSDFSYSIFAIGEVSSIEPLVLTDDLTPPAAGKSHVRFIHLSPDAPAVDITLTDGTIIFGNKSFKDFTDFTPLDAGTYDLQVRLAGTSTVVLDLPGIVLQNGKIYTVFAKGFVNGIGVQALGAEIIVNN